MVGICYIILYMENPDFINSFFNEEDDGKVFAETVKLFKQNESLEEQVRICKELESLQETLRWVSNTYWDKKYNLDAEKDTQSDYWKNLNKEVLELSEKMDYYRGQIKELKNKLGKIT